MTDFKIIQEKYFPKMPDVLAKHIAQEWDESLAIAERMGHPHGGTEVERSAFVYGYYIAWTQVHCEWTLEKMQRHSKPKNDT